MLIERPPLVLDLDRRDDRHDAPQRALRLQVGRFEQAAVRERRPVEDRHLGPVDLDREVVDAQHLDGRHQVLDGRDLRAVAAERGGELERADVARERRHLDAAVDAAEAHAGVGGGGPQRETDLAAGMDTDPGDGHRAGNRLLDEEVVGLVGHRSEVIEHGPCHAVHAAEHRSG